MGYFTLVILATVRSGSGPQQSTSIVPRKSLARRSYEELLPLSITTSKNPVAYFKSVQSMTSSCIQGKKARDKGGFYMSWRSFLYFVQP